MGLIVGKRIAGPEERLRTAIGSMVNGTIGGDSKIGMPIVETVRVPLVSTGGVYLAPSNDFQINTPSSQVWFNWGAPTQNTTTGVVYNGFSDYFSVTETDTYFIEVHIEMAVDTPVVAGTFTFEIGTFVDPVLTSHASDTETISGAMVFDLSASVPITAPALIVVPYESSVTNFYFIDDPASYIRVTQ